MIDWPSYNQSLVRRGEILFAYDFLDTWDNNLDKMNENKKGKPYSYPDSFILVVGYIRIYFHLPYRQTEGIIKSTGKNLPIHPCYSQICRRVNKLDITNNKIDNDNDNDESIIIAIDSTGIKVTNRGQWMQDKWNVRNKKGYLKIHIAVNIETKEILALEVTDEKVHDGKVMEQLVEQVLENKNIKIKSVLADGAYDSNKNFKYLQKKKIGPGIKVRKNSTILRKNNKMRNREVRHQIKDYRKWKKKRKYGHRWMAETAFSSIKRMFGEYTSAATSYQNMVKEMVMKISLYNLFRRMT
ncbi:MAG: IS5 family transposase [Nitrosopumilus sp.]|nr:IS5 family transposase [Nitrosopumilus sp.]